MRTSLRVCGPDQLRVLQQIFNSIWKELEEDGKAAPGDKALRDWVAAKIISCADPDVLDVEWMKWVVRNSMEPLHPAGENIVNAGLRNLLKTS
jgi:hypothetical protein